MDKTISISLGGFSFIVDDRAYQKLKNYLDEVRQSLNGMEGTDDIIADVEVRIAELFKQRLDSREVVNEHDVEYIIGVMGRPEQYLNEDDETAGVSDSGKTYTGKPEEGGKRKLYRDPDDKILGGVLSGLAHYLGIETWITRLIWILLFFADIPMTGTSFTILSYIILWIILPKAETATQKYEMFGQTGDFETIKRNVSSSVTGVKSGNSASNVFGEILRAIAKLFLIFFGIILLLIGISLLLSAISLLFLPDGLMPMKIFNHIVDYEWQSWATKIFGFLLLGIPAYFLMLFGIKMMYDKMKIHKTISLTAVGVWLIAILGASVLTSTLVKSFSRNIEYSNKSAYTVDSDTISLAFNEYKTVGTKKMKWGMEYDIDDFEEFDGKLNKKIERNVEVRQSPNNEVYLDVVYSSKGSSLDNARKNAEQIEYNYSMNSKGELTLDNYLSLPKDVKFRNQDVNIVVYLPKGKVLHTQNIRNVIFYDEQTNGKDYQRGNNKFYKFVGDHYECLNCQKVRIDSDSFDDDDSVNISEEGIKIQSGDKKVSISKDGVRVQNGDKKVNINNEKTRNDDTDSIDNSESGN